MLYPTLVALDENHAKI